MPFRSDLLFSLFLTVNVRKCRLKIMERLMAIRRATQKQQVMERLASVAPPGEQFIACVHTETGPSPWLNALFDRIPGLGLAIALTRKYYFFALTNTSVALNSASRWTNRPGDVVASFPRHSFPVTKYNRAAGGSKSYVHFPSANKPTRLNVPPVLAQRA